MNSRTFVPPPKKIVQENKNENIQKENNIFDMDEKETNEKKVNPKTTVVKNTNKKNSNSKRKADLFNFEEDAEEDIFSKKDGVSSIFDTDDNDKGKKDNGVGSIFD